MSTNLTGSKEIKLNELIDKEYQLETTKTALLYALSNIEMVFGSDDKTFTFARSADISNRLLGAHEYLNKELTKTRAEITKIDPNYWD